MKFVTTRKYTLILIIVLLNTLSMLIDSKMTEYDINAFDSEPDYDIRKLNEIDRLRIRFRKEENEESIEYDGDVDDLELPNIVETYEQDESRNVSESYESLSFSRNEDKEYLYQNENGSLFINEDEYNDMNELLVDKYLQNSFLKSAIIVKVTRNLQGFAIL